MQKLSAALPDGQVLAAVDIGSNSIHLIVARAVQGSLQTVASHRERVQLARNMGANYELDAAAIQRGIDCLQRMGAMLADAQPDKRRAVATYAVREAINRDVFLRLAEAALGCDVEVISGREEARLIFQAIAHTQKLEQSVLVIDIGGGSTELAIGAGFDPDFCASCRMGCVSFSEKFLDAGYSAENFQRANRAALQSIEKYLANLKVCHWGPVYATSGSAKALAQAVEHLGGNGTELTLDQLVALRGEIIRRGNVAWLTEYGISDNRMPLLAGGLAILIACLQCLGISELAYKDVALREGVLYEMLDRMRHPDIRLRSRQSMQSRYNIDVEHATRVAETAQTLLSGLPKGWFGNKANHLSILLEAAHLHETGLQISANGSQKHSAYVLENCDLPGYNRDDQRLLAALVRQYRKRIRSEDIPQLHGLDTPHYLRLLLVLRLAVVLNITRWPVDSECIALRADSDTGDLYVEASSAWLEEQILLKADLEREARYLQEHGIRLLFRH
ncbi:MAG: exopolyphosphatase [Pseudomonadales bacterium]|nr:exopolyphosphatase [Pseudomonadales bacterium]